MVKAVFHRFLYWATLTAEMSNLDKAVNTSDLFREVPGSNLALDTNYANYDSCSQQHH